MNVVLIRQNTPLETRMLYARRLFCFATKYVLRTCHSLTRIFSTKKRKMLAWHGGTDRHTANPIQFLIHK